MALLDSVFAAVARQLARPSGIVGRVVGVALNRGNRSAVMAAVEAAELAPGQVAADIGFGGGLGLGLLLDAVGATGVVHGIEISPTMLAQAARRFGSAVNEGRLQLHEATVGRLPLVDASVDAVVSTNTIYFVDDLDATTAQIARVLRPGGRLALGVADPEALARMPFTEYGFRLRPLTEVIESLTRAGFETVEDRRLGADERAFHIVLARAPA